MPRLSESMSEGTIVQWLRATGETVSPGDELVEVETDKATVTCEAESAGVLRILADTGERRAVGTPIANIGDSDGASADTRFRASPLARRLARERGVDLATVPGSGPGGRIVRADIDAAAGEAPAAATEDARGPVTVVRPSRAQHAAAERLTEAKRTVPEFTLTTEIDMTAAAELRDRIAAATGEAPTYNDLVVKAVALALRQHPRVNGAYHDGTFHLFERVNVGIAVATDGGLLVPTLFDADGTSLTGVSRATRALATRAREGRLTPAELDGGTFTVSNLGMYGIEAFTAVVNPPQAAILAVGTVRHRPYPDGDGVASRPAMRATLTCDHRILDGQAAAAFAARVRDLLTEPLVLLEGRSGT